MLEINERINKTRSEHSKVWGLEDWIVNNEEFNYCGKRLLLNKGFQCSIHYHKIKSEVFYVNKGLVLMQAYGSERLMKPGESLLIVPGTKHRFIGITNSEIMEYSSFHREQDSHREEPSGQVPEETFKSYQEKYKEELRQYEEDK